MARAQIGMIGLGVMGRNLARNLARHGNVVAVHDRASERVGALLDDHGSDGDFVGCATPEDLVAALERPRVAIVMVEAGAATEAVVDVLVPLLEPGDIVVDAGNSQFTDTRRREAALRDRGVAFVGVGVSGGEEGALSGPSIMAGGSVDAYRTVGPILESIAARAGDEPCCVHVGPDGAGHFVKMVHNGIEYADMQLIAEAYHLVRAGLGVDAAAVGDIFAAWNDGELEGYLVAITAEVLRQVDAKTGRALVDVILDEAGQKGTGRWAVREALEIGAPAGAIAEAVFARAVSSRRDLRGTVRLALGDAGDDALVPEADRNGFVEDVRLALVSSTIVAYAQGFDQIRAASDDFGWGIDLSAIARVWRGGCVIRARLLDRIADAYGRDPALPSLLADSRVAAELSRGEAAWRRVVSRAALTGIPVPTHASSLAYLDALRTERLPAALVQAQRDFFGAHTYRRVDVDGSFHTLWSGDRSEVES